jgi:hypothetical protein
MSRKGIDGRAGLLPSFVRFTAIGAAVRGSKSHRRPAKDTPPATEECGLDSFDQKHLNCLAWIVAAPPSHHRAGVPGTYRIHFRALTFMAVNGDHSTVWTARLDPCLIFRVYCVGRHASDPFLWNDNVFCSDPFRYKARDTWMGCPLIFSRLCAVAERSSPIDHDV